MVNVNINDALAIFVPNSSGQSTEVARLTIQSAKRTIPLIRDLAAAVHNKRVPLVSIDTFVRTESDQRAAESIKQVFDKHGSDKANSHDYHKLYGPILQNSSTVNGVLEVGLGTNNTDVVSHMGSNGKPGASLRAFKEYLPNANIYGADVDQRILFQEERISTFFVDQTNTQTFDTLLSQVPNNLDLIIDDGLHSPDANITFLLFALKCVKPNGWIVIEDIAKEAIPVWEIIAALLPSNYQTYIIQAKAGILFAINTSM